MPLVVPLIDGKNSLRDIAARLRGRATAVDVDYAISLLRERGLVTQDGSESASLEALDDSFSTSGLRREMRRRRHAASVHAFGKIDTGAIVRGLGTMGIRISKRAPLAVVFTDDYLRRELADFNTDCLRRRKPWLLAKPCGSTIWLGPLFQPDQSPCWLCLAQRLRDLRPIEAVVKKHGGPKLPESTAAGPPLFAALQIASGLAATEAYKFLSQGVNRRLGEQLVTLNLRTLAFQTHAVTRNPHCPACGKPPARNARRAKAIELRSRKKQFTVDGGHRVIAPEDTWENLERHISSVTGIVTKVESYVDDPCGLLHAYVAEHVFPPEWNVREAAYLGFYRRSAGKGLSAQQAKVSALCEALERYSGVFRPGDPRIRATCRELGSRAIHPNECMLFSEAQYAARRPSADGSLGPNDIPLPFDDGRTIDWTPLWSLTRGTTKFLPSSYCYFGYPAAPEEGFCRAHSNGNAAGNCIEEAILQGFLELVERDSIAIWWYNRIARPTVELETFGRTEFLTIRSFYREHGRTLDVFDISADFPIPVFAAVSRRARGSQPAWMMGFGAHFDSGLAISRALTEINQFLPSGLSGEPRPGADEQIPGDRFLIPRRNSVRKTASDYPGGAKSDLRDDVRECIRLAAARKLEVLVLDQTRAEIGLPVVKVVVPGLRLHWPRFAPGRLFDIPVKLNWLQRPRREDELNPAPFFI